LIRQGVLVTLRSALAATFFVIFIPAAAHSQGVEGTRALTLFVGTGLSLGGNVINEGVGTIDGNPSVVVEQAFSNHFSDALRIRFSASKGISYDKEVFATFSWGKINGTERIVGSISGYPLRLRLSNINAIDLEGGIRHYVRPEGPIRAYVAGVVGLRFLPSTGGTFRVVEVGFTANDLPYFKKSTVLLLGGDAGVSYDLSDRIALGVELGLRYQGQPGNAPLFADPGLSDVNNTGSRWTLPISAFARARF
jgi:hypothetical protein